MKSLNYVITHVLCLCLLTWSIASSWEARADGDGSGPTVGLPGIGSGSGAASPIGTPGADNQQNMQDCSAIDQNDTAAVNACMEHNKNEVTGTKQDLNMGSGMDTAGDINAEALQQDIAVSVFALMIAFFALVYIKTCPNQFSTIFFTAAGAVIIIFELIAWGTRIYMAASDDKVMEGSEMEIRGTLNSGGSGSGSFTDIQMKTLEKAEEKTREAAAWAKARSIFMIIASVLMAAAMVMAILEAIWRITSWGSYPDNCYKVAASNEEIKGPDSLYAKFYKNKNSLFPKQETRVLAAKYAEDAYLELETEQALEANAHQSPRPQIYHNFPPHEDDIAGLFKYYDEQNKKNPVTPMQEYVKNSSSAISWLIPEAQANAQTWWTVIAGIFGAVVVVIMVVYKSWESVSATSGWVRAVFFIVMAAIVIWATVIAKSAEDRLNQRADAYKNLREALKERLPDNKVGEIKIQGGTTHSPSGVVTVPTSQSTSYDPTKPLGGCATGSLTSETGPANDQTCGCDATNTCTKIQTPNVTLPNNIGFDDWGSLQSLGKDAQTGVNNLARNKSMGNGLGSLANGSMATKLKKVGDKLKDKYLDLLKKKGEKNPRPFDDIKKEFMARVVKDLNKAREKITPSMLSSLGELGGASVDKKIEDKVKTLGLDEVAKSKGINVAAPVAPPTTSSKLFDDDEAGSGLGDLGKVENVNTADALSGYETAEQDILKDTGVSIFEQISSRYRRSAFPIFFMKKKDLGATTEAKPENKATPAPANK